MTEWFEQWFGEKSHALYPHRDEEDARRAVALVRRVAPWGGYFVLDYLNADQVPRWLKPDDELQPGPRAVRGVPRAILIGLRP